MSSQSILMLLHSHLFIKTFINRCVHSTCYSSLFTTVNLGIRCWFHSVRELSVELLFFMDIPSNTCLRVASFLCRLVTDIVKATGWLLFLLMQCFHRAQSGSCFSRSLLCFLPRIYAFSAVSPLYSPHPLAAWHCMT